MSQWLDVDVAEDEDVAEEEGEAGGVQGDDRHIRHVSHHPTVCTGFVFFVHRGHVL